MWAVRRFCRWSAVKSRAADRKRVCMPSGTELCRGAGAFAGGYPASVGCILCAFYLFPVLRWKNASEKIRIYPVCGGVIATICILPVAVMPWQTEKAVGNEQLASFPELRKEDGSFNTGILNEFSDYFADHFGLRHEMITLNDQLTGTVLKTLDSSSVLLGKDDWLFYKKAPLRTIPAQNPLQPGRVMRPLMYWV